METYSLRTVVNMECLVVCISFILLFWIFIFLGYGGIRPWEMKFRKSRGLGVEIVTGKLSVETNPAVLAMAIYIWSIYETFTTNINENTGDNNMIVGDGQ